MPRESDPSNFPPSVGCVPVDSSFLEGQDDRCRWQRDKRAPDQEQRGPRSTRSFSTVQSPDDAVVTIAKLEEKYLASLCSYRISVERKGVDEVTMNLCFHSRITEVRYLVVTV
ncbi:hypothetical protein AVEN_6808-1 [Araneus ventricosus]|uniref:Uncharacterized protein n=1 Tax=Araneus ventricosus TaxID=182803 RepID=A0A4Y2I8R0_ARAVE|nr:hypothetical protein AVEN_6808-1 [Araneus ventricosus]